MCTPAKEGVCSLGGVCYQHGCTCRHVGVNAVDEALHPKSPLDLVPAKNNVCSVCYEHSSNEHEAFIHAAVTHCGFRISDYGWIYCGNCGSSITTTGRSTEELTGQFRRHYKYHALLVRLTDTGCSHDQWVCRACGMQIGASCVVEHVHKHTECPIGMTLHRSDDFITEMLLLVCDTCGQETSCLDCAKAHVACEKANAFAHAMFQMRKLGEAETTHIMRSIRDGCVSCQYHGKMFVPAL